MSRIAAASPAGPAPTITTSNSIASRAGRSARLMASSELACFSNRPCSTNRRESWYSIVPCARRKVSSHEPAAMTPLNRSRPRAARLLSPRPGSMRSSATTRSNALPTEFDRRHRSGRVFPRAEAVVAGESRDPRSPRPGRPQRAEGAAKCASRDAAPPPSARRRRHGGARGGAQRREPRELRAMLDGFEGCSLRAPRPSSSSPTAIRRRA